jgi:hypothetical protein
VSAPPASEPGTPTKKNADTRKAELTADIQALLKQRAELRDSLERDRAVRTPPRDAPAASSPATETRSLSQIIQSPDISKPILTDTEFFATYPDAGIVDLQRYAARYELARDKQESVQAKAVETRHQSFLEKMAPALTADPEFWSKQDRALVTAPTVDELIRRGQAETAGPLNYAAHEILTCGSPKEVIEHLTAHADERAALLTMSPAEVIRAIARLDARFEKSSVPDSPVVPPKATTSAPTPPTTLGSRQTVPTDDAKTAVMAGDFRRYKAARNREEVAS